jgi:hypothetical protein
MGEPSLNANGRGSAGHESSDLEPRMVALFAVGLAALLVAVMAATYWIHRAAQLRYAKQQAAVSPLAYTREPMPEPRLQVSGAEELRKLRAAEDAALNSYGWIDEEAGFVRIPIDRAIEILATKGLPARPRSNIRESRPGKPEREKQDAAK